jgi:transposase-like protein
VYGAPHNNTGEPDKRRPSSPEFRFEPAHLVVDQHYTVSDAADAMDEGLSTMSKWVKNCVMWVRIKRQKSPR